MKKWRIVVWPRWWMCLQQSGNSPRTGIISWLPNILTTQSKEMATTYLHPQTFSDILRRQYLRRSISFLNLKMLYSKFLPDTFYQLAEWQDVFSFQWWSSQFLELIPSQCTRKLQSTKQARRSVLCWLHNMRFHSIFSRPSPITTGKNKKPNKTAPNRITEQIPLIKILWQKSLMIACLSSG